MEKDAEQLASDWIAFARHAPDDASDQVFVDGWALYDLVEDNPPVAWEVIKRVISKHAIQVSGHKSHEPHAHHGRWKRNVSCS